MRIATPIEAVRVRALRLPTAAPECDGTLCWDATELIVVQIRAAGVEGLGYSYTQARPAAALIRDKLAPLLEGQDALALPALWQRMNAALRNAGRPGLGLMAIAAVDIALWDLKARLLDISLVALWGRARDAVPVYGSGGFTNEPDVRLQQRLDAWCEQGLRAMKIKVGSDPHDDARRVRLARTRIGDGCALMVDANGACDRVQALWLAAGFAEAAVSWFEEPVTSDDLDGLRFLADRAPPGMAIAAGEYAQDGHAFRALLDRARIGVLQADATRCGYTGFLQAAALCTAFDRPLSAHCAPAIHAPIGAAAGPLRHLEYFDDHVRLEARLFDGIAALRDGALWPDDGRAGHGLSLKADAVATLELH